MKAKDTITKTTVYNCHNTLEERLAEQAEISFKADRKEERQRILRLGWAEFLKECEAELDKKFFGKPNVRSGG